MMLLDDARKAKITTSFINYIVIVAFVSIDVISVNYRTLSRARAL